MASAGSLLAGRGASESFELDSESEVFLIGIIPWVCDFSVNAKGPAAGCYRYNLMPVINRSITSLSSLSCFMFPSFFSVSHSDQKLEYKIVLNAQKYKDKLNK